MLFIVIILWLIQTVFLNDFYKAIKLAQIKETAQYIVDNEDAINIDDYIQEKSFRDDQCIHVIKRDGTLLHSTNRYRECPFRNLTLAEIQNLYNAALLQANDEKLEISTFVGGPKPKVDGALGLDNKMENILYIKVSQEDNMMIAIDSILTPVGTTASVLRVQILYVTALLIASAGILAYILSKKIAQPIIDINRSAKKLASGDYDLELPQNSYLEIEELNETMKSTSQDLKKADRAKEELIANISHDLRTPLTMITGYAEVVRDLPGEDTQENIQVIIDEAARLTRLVNDIMAISHISTHTELTKQRFNITKLTGEIIQRCAKLTEADGFVFEFEAQEQLEVLGDEIKLSQAIYNLIGNAISHSGADKKIIIRQETITKNQKQQVKITIIDNGPGIAPEHIDDIWERYYKVDKTHIRSSVGSGLGLSIVKNVIEAHGGSTGVNSELGKGSQFWIMLPQAND